jgi:hypothetical protein
LRVRVVAIVSVAVGLLAVSGLALAASPSVGSLTEAEAGPTSVLFSASASGTEDGSRWTLSGHGELIVDRPFEQQTATTQRASGTVLLTIRRAGSGSVRLRMEIIRAVPYHSTYHFGSFQNDETHFQTLHLPLRVIETSAPRSCPLRRTGILKLNVGPKSLLKGGSALEFSGCKYSFSAVGTPVTITPTPKPWLTTPTSVTLKVNDWSLTATKAKPAAYLHHENDQPLESREPLSIRANVDRPLPKGWKLTVYHNGDVLSEGNGVYYKVCEIVGPSTTTSCSDTRPGRVGPFDDTVWAAVSAPTYLAMHSDISFHFNAP